jgi:hypothetical protein
MVPSNGWEENWHLRPWGFEPRTFLDNWRPCSAAKARLLSKPFLVASLTSSRAHALNLTVTVCWIPGAHLSSRSCRQGRLPCLRAKPTDAVVHGTPIAWVKYLQHKLCFKLCNRQQIGRTERLLLDHAHAQSGISNLSRSLSLSLSLSLACAPCCDLSPCCSLSLCLLPPPSLFRARPLARGHQGESGTDRTGVGDKQEDSLRSFLKARACESCFARPPGVPHPHTQVGSN